MKTHSALATISIIALAALTFAGCQKAVAPSTGYSTTDTQITSTPLTSEPMPTPTGPAEVQSSGPQKGDTVAILDTDFGTIKIRLFANGVPTLAKNFVDLAKAGKYDGVPFHRVVKDFMIQGGDFTNRNGTGGYSSHGPNTYLANEINPSYSHLYGTVSMAKSALPTSIGSQFFIVTGKKDATFLDGNYSPFGQVYEGMPVAEKIQNLQIDGTEKPGKIVNVKKVTIETFS